MTIPGVASTEAGKLSAGETSALGVAVPAAADPRDYQRIRDVLVKANYTEEGVCGLLGIENLSRLRERKLPALLRRTGGGTALETLVRLFVLGQPADVAATQRAIAPMTMEKWREIGLVDVAGTSAQGRLQLRCYQGLVLAYDFPRRGRGGLRQDYVMGVSPSSLVLAGMTVRREIASTLDLGSGCGIQAILAAPHSKRVVGVDCNPRAVAIAQFNAKLNGIENVDFREGDMFGPVGTETFDLIVSNPPFIISPEKRHFFLNSGLEGDEICRRIVQEAPRFLKDGGYCILNANWAVVEKEDCRARLASWFEGTGCDGLVFQQDTRDLGEYAASLIEVGNNEEAEYMRLFDEWMDYYAKLHITGIGQGVIVMRRASSRANWFAVEAAPANIAYPSGGDVARLVEQRTFLHSLDGEKSFLDAHLKLAVNVRLEQVCEARNGAWHTVSGQVRRVGGLEYSGVLDGASAAALAQWDGTRTVKDYLGELAVVLNTDFAALVVSASPIIRRLVEQGFLVPPEV
jgi:SAM-dependent methyltransferase